MKRIISNLVACFSLILFFNSQVLAAPVIGTWNSTRSTTANIANGSFTHELNASLTSNFPGASYVTTPTLTPQFLSGINLLFIDSAMTDSQGITPLSASEQTALLNFVKGGGRAVVTEGYSPFVPASQSMLTPFGVTIANDGLSGILVGTPTTQSSPVINGPFGDTTSIILYGAGILTNLGPYATSLANMDANGKPVLAEIPAHALSPTSGRVLIITDSTEFIDEAAGGAFPLGEALFLNSINYLSTPEPSSLGSVC